jgi:pimeloyl-[acyl-carrier protein] methyl ester esterase
MSAPLLHVERYTPAGAAAGADAQGSAGAGDHPRTGALPIVMLHGWGMNLRVFDRLRAQLAGREPAGADAQDPPLRETWAIDLPGHGRSPWWPAAATFDAQCASVLASLPSRCVLAGWSMGAMLALQLAATQPARIAALVLLSPTPKFARSDDWPQGMDAEALGHFRSQLAQDWRRILDDFIWLQVRGSRDAEEAGQVLEAALAQHGAPQPGALAAGLDLLETTDLRAITAQATAPALVITGLNDRVTLPAAARWLAVTLPHAQLLEVPRAGHAPFISHHIEVAAAVRTFLTQVRAT